MALVVGQLQAYHATSGRQGDFYDSKEDGENPKSRHRSDDDDGVEHAHDDVQPAIHFGPQCQRQENHHARDQYDGCPSYHPTEKIASLGGARNGPVYEDWQLCTRENSRMSTTAKKSAAAEGESPSRLIDARIKELDDWRGKTLARVRALIKAADPEVIEEWKWRGVPVWSHDGILCTGETYKSVVKLTFAKGASLKDPAKLFNSSLDGNVRRAIDIHEDEAIDEAAFKALIRAAAALNASKPAKKPRG